MYIALFLSIYNLLPLWYSLGAMKDYSSINFIPTDKAKSIARVIKVGKEIEGEKIKETKEKKASQLYRSGVKTKDLTQTKQDREKIMDFVLDKLENHLTNPDKKKRERAFNNLRNILLKKFLIKSDQFEEYFEEHPTTDEMKGDRIKGIIKEQESSLDKWLNHLSSDDCRYPFWLKYVTLKSIIRMGDFDFDKKSFTKREHNRPTYKPFPDLNEEALNKVLSSIKNNFPKTEDGKWNEIIKTKDFSKMYGYALDNVLRFREQNEEIEEISKWKEYPQIETEEELEKRKKELQEDVKDKGSGWCFATNDFDAEHYLKNSNQLIGFTRNKKGELIPRLGISYITNDKGEKIITEARGVANGQNVEPGMEEEMEEKMKEFVNAEDYKKRTEDMKKLKSIHEKCFKKERKDKKRILIYQDNAKLTKEELEFIYEINEPIQGFWVRNEKDRRIKEILSQRKVQEDVATIFECSKDQVATNPLEINKNTKVYLGEIVKEDPSWRLFPEYRNIFSKFKKYNIENIYTSFPKEKIKKVKNISWGGKIKEELFREINEKEIKLHGGISEIIWETELSKQEITSDVFIVPSNSLKARSLSEIRKRGKELGLRLCPIEMLPHFRLKYNQPMNEWLNIATEEVRNSKGQLISLHMDRDNEVGLWACYSDNDFSGNWEFAFLSPDFDYDFSI